MSATYEVDWRTSLREFAESMARLGIEEIQRIEGSLESDNNIIQVEW